MRSDIERLRDIYDAIIQIERYAAKGESAFRREELIQTWIVYHLQIIGEAARAVEAGFQQKYAQIPWGDLIGLRNILVHQYFRIDEDIVWSIVKNNVPELKTSVEYVLRELEKTNL
jgi:uncharacterized protein with HEPN domain